MKKTFILLTRSYKFGGYCIAGIETGTKKWLRFVSSADPSGNEIPKNFFEPFNDLDILEVETLGEVPYICQTENLLLDLSVPPVRRGRITLYELLGENCVSTDPDLFGNPFSYLTQGEVTRRRGSLGLFAVDSLCFDYYDGDDGKWHYRSRFLYRGQSYAGLSVTDPVYRRDEYAGQSIPHALIVVSLPALPYSNGNYYKFIAKILPISAGQAELLSGRRAAAAGKPRARLFSRDVPDPAKDDPARAAEFLRSLAEGRDPDTQEELDPSRVFSPSYAAWFRYCASLTERAAEQKEQRGTDKKFDKKSVYLLREKVERISISDTPITATEIKVRVNALREPYGKDLTSTAIGNFFLEAGMLAALPDRSRKIPTDLGREYGIVTEVRNSSFGTPYSVVLYGPKAQQFFLDNIERCVEVIGEPVDITPKPVYHRPVWKEEDAARLKRRYEEGAEIGELAAEFGRSHSYIQARLSDLGLNTGEEERDRRWKSWDGAEDEALMREFAAGVSLEELAQTHKRTAAAVIARLRKLGVRIE